MPAAPVEATDTRHIVRAAMLHPIPSETTRWPPKRLVIGRPPNQKNPFFGDTRRRLTTLPVPTHSTCEVSEGSPTHGSFFEILWRLAGLFPTATHFKTAHLCDGHDTPSQGCISAHSLEHRWLRLSSALEILSCLVRTRPSK